ncbi:hypothetical protein QQF64_034446, partial [Cirrhinus molitorella]
LEEIRDSEIQIGVAHVGILDSTLPWNTEEGDPRQNPPLIDQPQIEGYPAEQLIEESENPESMKEIQTVKCEGEEERVPRLRPDCSAREWQAVGRVWVKGYVDHEQSVVEKADQGGLDENDAKDLLDLFSRMGSYCLSPKENRPDAHTCGAVLDLPCTYSSYPEFHAEFDNILNGDCFAMDML